MRPVAYQACRERTPLLTQIPPSSPLQNFPTPATLPSPLAAPLYVGSHASSWLRPSTWLAWALLVDPPPPPYGHGLSFSGDAMPVTRADCSAGVVSSHHDPAPSVDPLALSLSLARSHSPVLTTHPPLATSRRRLLSGTCTPRAGSSEPGWSTWRTPRGSSRTSSSPSMRCDTYGNFDVGLGGRGTISCVCFQLYPTPRALCDALCHTRDHACWGC